MNSHRVIRRRNVFLALIVLLLAASQTGIDVADSSSANDRLPATVYNRNPSNYRDLLDDNTLQAGDTLNLAAGTYLLGLPFDGDHGNSGAPIIVQGPSSGPPAIFKARGCCNTVSFRDSSYIIVRNLEVDGRDVDGTPLAVDAVKSSSDAACSHHITLENLFIHDHNYDQQTVGISTKCTAWNWIVRRNIINSTGTGMYFGDSDGGAPFVDGIIEYNLIVDTIGYNMQIKHQNNHVGVPVATGDGTTVIRHNVFSKANNASGGGDARPNLLVGHWPLSGTGSNDTYLIYGNFFYQNPSGEPLFQGEGNIAMYDNLFVNNVGNGDAVWIQQHNDFPREIRVFNNTVVATGEGIRVSSVDMNYTQKVIGNAVFADVAPPVNAPDQQDNVMGNYNSASTYLVNPFSAPCAIDLFPKPGQLTGAAVDTTWFNTFESWNIDFDGNVRNGTYRGAYYGAGANPHWQLALTRKPVGMVAPCINVYLPAIMK